ncbi:MAG: ABC transporter permease [Candidatus Fimivicinus sp.]|nr:ABC transporter permease [Oscillospiraceae bacterium]MDY5592044.1 ABC transporter permease [Candidatus Fimivicinus sp.]
MFYKLAFKNVKKSLSDYVVYFLTLSFGVCLFYVFNAVESQQTILLLSEQQHALLQTGTEMLSYLSVFISFVLAGLILYANNFLIKRRKRELGLYMTLGMDRGKISRILTAETFIIGLFSLGVGLLIGVAASQGMSVLTAKLMNVPMKYFAFTFSKDSLLKTILYFGVIFLVVMLFNIRTVSKYKLIDLIHGGRKNETLRINKLWVYVVVFLLSLACLGTAYYLIIDNGMFMLDNQFYASLILGTIGTVLFFLSLSGFLLRIAKGNKRLYYKGLNMFILRQLNSKINTNFLSMSIICIMLLVTIGTFSCGLGAVDVMAGQVDETAPYDITLTSQSKKKGPQDIEANLKAHGFDFTKQFSGYTQVWLYHAGDLTFQTLYDFAKENMGTTYMDNNDSEHSIPLISLSDYNKLLTLRGEAPISLASDEYAVVCNVKEMHGILEAYVGQGQTFTINGAVLRPSGLEIQPYQLQNSMMSMESGTLIIPDAIAKRCEPMTALLNANYTKPGEEGDNAFTAEIAALYGKGKDAPRPYTRSSSHYELYMESGGTKLMISYFVIYVGVVFLITCAAVLALQQLSEASDNTERYRLLRRLGAPSKMIDRALFMQILAYFMLPLGLAVIHSVVGIYVVNNAIAQFGNLNALPNIIMAALLFLVIYGGYFLATFLGSRKMIRSRER